MTSLEVWSYKRIYSVALNRYLLTIIKGGMIYVEGN